MSLPDDGYLTFLPAIALADVERLNLAQKSYGDSWKKRGGIGAYMMLARKIDRLERQALDFDWDVFALLRRHPEANGPLDDIRDLRRYLMLVEAEAIRQGLIAPDTMGVMVKYPAAPGTKGTDIPIHSDEPPHPFWDGLAREPIALVDTPE